MDSKRQVSWGEIISEDSPLLPLAEAWQKVAARAYGQPYSLTPTALHEHVAQAAYGFLVTISKALGDNNMPNFDITPKDGRSPLDEGFFVRVGFLSEDFPAAARALHEQIERWADTALHIAACGADVQRQEDRIVLTASPCSIERKPLTRPRAHVVKFGAE